MPADWFAGRLGLVVCENGQALEPDVLSPLPRTRIRRQERGFNSAKLLSKRLLAKRLKLLHQGILLAIKRPCPDAP
jgi:predicted amidophosphoribosyltransferase